MIFGPYKRSKDVRKQRVSSDSYFFKTFLPVLLYISIYLCLCFVRDSFKAVTPNWLTLELLGKLLKKDTPQILI